MLKLVAHGVLVHQSAFCQSNAVVVQGRGGLLLVDPGIAAHEMQCLVDDVQELGRPVVAGFSTHPHWDHLLWDARLGAVPRYGTARCADTIHSRMSQPGWATRIAAVLPPELADDVPLDLLGLITGLPVGTATIPWDGPVVRIVEHQAHAPGHAALVIDDAGILLAGDMLSDVLIPILDLMNGSDAIEDYLAALEVLEDAAQDVSIVVPGHGTVGGADQVRARIDQDRAYVRALRDGEVVDDPRIGPSATYGEMSGVHDRQRQWLGHGADLDPGHT